MWIIKDKRTGKTFKTEKAAVVEALDSYLYEVIKEDDMKSLYGDAEPTVTTRRKKK